MHRIVIHNATAFRAAHQFACANNKGPQFENAFVRFLTLLTTYAPKEEAKSGETVEIMIRPDFVPHSFVGHAGLDRGTGQPYTTFLAGGLIRHQGGTEEAPTYEWSIHT